MLSKQEEEDGRPAAAAAHRTDGPHSLFTTCLCKYSSLDSEIFQFQATDFLMTSFCVLAHMCLCVFFPILKCLDYINRLLYR